MLARERNHTSSVKLQDAYSTATSGEKRMKNSKKNSGGYWMLFGLVAFLAAPIAIHHVMAPAVAEPSLHADASAAQ